ncbi:MAG: glutathione S-transferase family protein [Alphaproteobacteria bacterium]|nr:glutathione S-transferase family protein [Alphaproteobacteria bacterium]
MYTLIGFPKTRAFRVLWMLEELGVEYEINPVPPRSDAAKEFNPSGKVPALKVGDDIIIDSVAICQFLADTHGKLTEPVGSIARAQQDSWTQFAMDDVESPLWFNAKNTFVLPEELRSETAQKACKYDFANAMAAFAKRLGQNTYVMGDKFTVPDLLLGHCAMWAKNGPGWPFPPGPVTEYFERVLSRPAHAKATKVRDSFS